MSTSTATRRDAARALGRFMGTRAARDLFAFNGYVSGTRILPVLESDPFDEVIEDHTRSGETTVVAVYYPERTGREQFAFMKWEAPTTEPPSHLEKSDGFKLGRGRDGRTSSVGMVLDYMDGRINNIKDNRLTTARIPDVLRSVSSKTFAMV